MIYIEEGIPKRINETKFYDAIDWVHNRFNLDSDVIAIGFDTLSEGRTGEVGIEDSDEILMLLSRRIGTNTAIATVFHEMVHINQILTGRLNIDEQRWTGELYVGNYEDSPWEKEAWEMEKVLLNEYKAYVQSTRDNL